MGWMEVAEVQPYYCEGIIHLTALFETNILDWADEQLIIDISADKYEKLKQWYTNTYTDLAKHYLDKKDATQFLNRFAKKDGKYFMPINPKAHSFVKYYFKRYQEIGQELDTLDSKENYIK